MLACVIGGISNFCGVNVVLELSLIYSKAQIEQVIDWFNIKR